MSVDLDNPTPETAQHVRLIESLCKERDSLRSALHLAEARIASAEKARDEATQQLEWERDHSQMLSDNTTRLHREKAEVEAFCAKVRGEYTEAIRERDEATARIASWQKQWGEANDVGFDLLKQRDHALSQRDRWHSEAKRIGDNYEQAVRDLDEQRRENGRLMAMVGDAMREIERMRRDRDSYANSGFERQLDEARKELAELREPLERQIQAAIDAATTTPEGCVVNQFSSRACEQGTRSCEVRHATTTPEAGE